MQDSYFDFDIINLDNSFVESIVQGMEGSVLEGEKVVVTSTPKKTNKHCKFPFKYFICTCHIPKNKLIFKKMTSFMLILT